MTAAMRRLIFTPHALDDLDGSKADIAQDRFLAAEHVIERLADACAAPCIFPERGRVGRRRGTRERTTVWPCVIIHRALPDVVSIKRINHGARRR